MSGARHAISVSVLTAAMAFALGCGSQGVQVKSRGAELFAERCAGCHTLRAAGTRGSILGERPTGPNLNKRTLTRDDVLLAIRNGGFSGAIMPQNVVLGKDAVAVADFVSKYSGAEVKTPASPSAAGATSEGSTSSTSGEASTKAKKSRPRKK